MCVPSPATLPRSYAPSTPNPAPTFSKRLGVQLGRFKDDAPTPIQQVRPHLVGILHVAPLPPSYHHSRRYTSRCALSKCAGIFNDGSLAFAALRTRTRVHAHTLHPSPQARNIYAGNCDDESSCLTLAAYAMPSGGGFRPLYSEHIVFCAYEPTFVPAPFPTNPPAFPALPDTSGLIQTRSYLPYNGSSPS